jgi:hypothetical protein
VEVKRKRNIKLVIITSSLTLTIIRSLKIIREIDKQMGENTARTRDVLPPLDRAPGAQALAVYASPPCGL